MICGAGNFFSEYAVIINTAFEKSSYMVSKRIAGSLLKDKLCASLGHIMPSKSNTPLFSSKSIRIISP